ncbi:MAG: hypothetical protein WC821_05020 [archaeon]|jgi:hypothetical protein
MVQRTKLFGLKKLKKIVGTDPRWVVSPHKVYASPEQFRLAHARGNKRLLVRGDEVGRNYTKFNWASMPRFDVGLRQFLFSVDQKNAEEQKARKDIGKIGKHYIDGHFYNPSASGMLGEKALARKKMRLIVHPTRAREKIETTGQALITNRSGQTKLYFWLSFNAGKETVHRQIPKDVSVEYVLVNGKWKQLTKFLYSKNASRRKADLVIKRMNEFIKRGVELNQIKLGRLETEINFLTWKGDPKIEVFDLIEKRDNSSQARQS